jgi:hypothetical protein
MPNSTLLKDLPTETADADTIIAIDTNQDGVLGKTELQNVDLSILNRDSAFISALDVELDYINAVSEDTAPQLGGELDANSNKIVNVSDPTGNQDAATKNYVDVNAAGAGSVPIGAVVPWLKSYTNTPSLGPNFLECNGQTVSDTESPFDGQTLPDLNGNNRFLRPNSTSGGTGGNNNHNHTISGDLENVEFGAGEEFYSLQSGDSQGSSGSFNTSTSSNIPPYYDVVMIIRIK